MKKTNVMWVCAVLFVAGIILPCAYAKKVEITFVFPGTSGPERVWAENMQRDFNAAYPDIKLKTLYIGWAVVNEKVFPMAAAGTPPELFFVEGSRTKDLESMGFLQPLDKWTKEWPDFKYMLPGAIEGGSVKGKLYMLANDIKLHSHGGVYHKKKLEKYWGPIESINTWEDWIAAAKACHNQDYDGDGKIDTYGVIFSPDQVGTYQLLQALEANNGPMILPDLLNLDFKKEWMEIFDWYQKMGQYRTPGSDSMTYKELFRAFGSELPVFVPCMGSYLYGNLEPLFPEFFINENVGIWIGPPGPSHKGPARLVNTAYGSVMFKNIPENHKEAAWKFMAFTLSKEQGAKLAGVMHLPSRSDYTTDDILKDVLYDPPEKYRWYLEAYLDLVKKGGGTYPTYPNYNYEEVLALEKLVYLDLVRNKVTPEQAYYKMYRGLAEIWGRE